eukprot:2544473-Prymnesium_polylepis.1
MAREGVRVATRACGWGRCAACGWRRGRAGGARCAALRERGVFQAAARAKVQIEKRHAASPAAVTPHLRMPPS